jgi:hypothetical protein
LLAGAGRRNAIAYARRSKTAPNIIRRGTRILRLVYCCLAMILSLIPAYTAAGMIFFCTSSSLPL